MNRYEQIKQMNIDEFSEWLYNRFNLCQREILCGKCEHKEWCDCLTVKDYKKWLEKAKCM